MHTARACKLVLVLLLIWGAVLLPEMTPRFLSTVLLELNLVPVDVDSGSSKKPVGSVMGTIVSGQEPSPNSAQTRVPNRPEERFPLAAAPVDSIHARLILPEDLILEAVDDLYTIDIGTTLKVAAPGLLANDRAAAGVRLRALLVAPPRNGELALKPDGSFTYTPGEDFSGIDRFTYRIADGVRQSAPATVSITVREIIPEPEVSLLAGAEVAATQFTGPRIAAITDFSEKVGGVRLFWQKAYYQDLDIDGSAPLEIPFGLNRPFGYNPAGTARYPLVVYLHGSGARSNWTSSNSDPDLRDHSLVNAALKRQTARFFAKAAQTQPPYYTFVLAPQVPSKSQLWVGKGPDAPYTQTNTPGNTYSEYMHLLENLIAFVTASANNASLGTVLGIDANDIELDQIYVVGDSDGAKGTWDILARRPALFAGAIASAGTGPRNRLTELRQNPLWTIHGILDDTVPNALPSQSQPYGSGTLGMLALLDPTFDNTFSTVLVYKDDHALSGDDPLVTDNLIYSEFESFYTHSDVAVGWTSMTSGTLLWLFAQTQGPAQNTPPVANDDSATTVVGTAVTIGVLGNDTDADLDALTVQSVTQGANGAVTNNGSSVTYTPNAGFSGTDSFNYTASDGKGGTDTAKVTVTVTSGSVLFIDDFGRSDSSIVGNSWTEAESAGAATAISANRLFFTDTSDVVNRPMVYHSFTKLSSGKVTWEFDFNWTRTGSEGGYRLFMQLGDGGPMNTSSQDEGVGVNLIWTVIGGVHERLGYRRGGVDTALATLRGTARISVEADLGTHTFSVAIGGTTVGSGIPFDRIVDLSRVRFFTDGLNEQNFSGRSFDELVIRR